MENKQELLSHDIVQLMVDNIDDYKRNIKELLIKHFEDNPELKKSWSDWFNNIEDDTTILHPVDNESENFSELEIKEFKENWGQTHEEICSALNLKNEDAGDFLRSDYFWLEENQKWYPTFSSVYSEREQAIADYLMINF